MCNMYGSFYMFQCFHMDDWHKDQFLKKKEKKHKRQKESFGHERKRKI